MINLFYAATPNVVKNSILFRELGLNYRLIPINVRQGVNKYKVFKKYFPVARIPCVFDDGLFVFESIAILLHYSNKSQKFTFSSDTNQYTEMLKWMIWIETALLGALSYVFLVNHRFKGDDKFSPVMDMLNEQSSECLMTLNKELEGKEYFVDNKYSILDMQAFALLNALYDRGQIGSELKNIIQYVEKIQKRKAVIEAYEEFNSFNWNESISENDLEVIIKQLNK
jgi:GSH-dependent disulfide-bond oxidoreductase